MKLTFCRRILIVFTLLISHFSYSQHRADNWVFNEFGLKFQSDTVIIRKDFAPHQYRGMGVISDTNGELLFYSDGFDVWNKNHIIMPNGKKVNPLSTFPATHESLVIPKPGSQTQYYLFTVEPDNGQTTSGLYYSIIDMSLQNGMGDVVSRGKKIISGVSNRMTAVLHQNRRDVWLIVQISNSKRYFSYLITPTNISETIFISEGNKVLSYSYGQLKASPDGRKVVSTYDGFDLFDFNNQTGELSNIKNFASPFIGRGVYGAEFSSDATKLFVHVQGSTGESGLYQYDLKGESYDQINNSRILLINEQNNTLNSLQLAPNGKIYITKGGGGGGIEHLGVIENPNVYGKNCKVKENGLYLQGSVTIGDNTPIFIQDYLFKTSFDVSNTCVGSLAEFRITNETNLDSVRWFFGEGSSSTALHPQFNYSKSVDYVVSLIAHYPDRIDTIKKTITINPSPEIDLGKDTTVCYGYELTAGEGFTSYLWNTGENTHSVLVKKAGNYKVTVSNAYGCLYTDSVFLNVADQPQVNLADSIKLGTSDSIQINPGNFKSYKWSTGQTSPTIYVKTEGWYAVTVENETGCTATKSFYAYKNTLPQNDILGGWKLLNPLPSVFTALDITFLNSQVGFIINSSQILRTTDGGNKWDLMGSITSGKRIAFKENIGYIVGDGGAIYKSTTMGGGWNKLNFNFTDNLNAISLISKDTVFITGDSRLFVSFDGGQSWNSSVIKNVNIEDSYFTSSKVGHIACNDGTILKTIDGGVTWRITSSVTYYPAGINRIYFVDSTTGFASRGYSDILKTTDGGETWVKSTGTTDKIFSYFFLDKQRGFIAGDHGVIFKTTNGGATWEWIGYQVGRVLGTNINSICFIDSMTGYAVGMGGRILKTIDGGKTWNPYSITYNTIKQIKFVTDQIGYGLAGNTFFKTIDGGANWINIGSPTPSGNVVQFDFINSNIGFCIAGGTAGSSLQVAKVYKTMDGGKTWTATNNGADIHYESLSSIDFVDPFLGYVSGGYSMPTTFKTIDGGNTWQQINTISFTQLQFLNSQVGYACNGSKRIYKTTDAGKSWMITLNAEDQVKSIYFVNEKIGYSVGNVNANYKTMDGGETWQKLDLPSSYYTRVRFYNANIGFASDDYGKIYQTSNGGLSWDLLNKPFSFATVELYGKDLYVYGENGIIIKNTVTYKPAVIYVSMASGITNSMVTLNGNVTSNEGAIRDIQFEYGENSIDHSVKVMPDSIQANGTSIFSTDVKQLKANTTYSYRLTATYNGIKYTSEIKEFKTLPDFEITNIFINGTTTKEADLSCKIISNNAGLSNIQFEYGTNNNFYLHIDATPNSIAGGTSATVNGHLNSLKPKTVYSVRIKATYNDSVVYSQPSKFGTSSDYSIQMFNPTISGIDAIIQGYVSSYSDSIKNIELEYGTTREYKHSVAVTPDFVSRYYSKVITSKLTNLNPDSIYYYRIKALMGNETIYSDENVLRPSGGVIIVPLDIEKLSDSSVILKGLLNSTRTDLWNVQFIVGMTKEMDQTIPSSPDRIYSNQPGRIECYINNLLPETTYYFRIVALDGALNPYQSEIFTYYTGPTSIGKIESDVDQVTVYPNPAHHTVTIKSANSIKKVDLIASNGKMMASKINAIVLNLSSYPNGLYFIKVYTSKGLTVRKILKE